jgi:hypothetical protein
MDLPVHLRLSDRGRARNALTNKQQTDSKEAGMKTKTNVKAGGFNLNHNQKLAGGVRVKTAVKAGALSNNHNETATVAG